MTTADGALLIIALVIAWSIYKAHKNEENNFNLMDLLMENGRVSRIACAFMTTLVITSWLMVTIASTGKMTEGYLAIYGGLWVTPIVAKLFSAAPPAETKKEPI